MNVDLEDVLLLLSGFIMFGLMKLFQISTITQLQKKIISVVRRNVPRRSIYDLVDNREEQHSQITFQGSIHFVAIFRSTIAS